MGWSKVGCWGEYNGAGTPIADGAAEGSCQKATLSGNCEGPNREYADMLVSCCICIESRKPARAAWGWWYDCGMVVDVESVSPHMNSARSLECLHLEETTNRKEEKKRLKNGEEGQGGKKPNVKSPKTSKVKGVG